MVHTPAGAAGAWFIQTVPKFADDLVTVATGKDVDSVVNNCKVQLTNCLCGQTKRVCALTLIKQRLCYLVRLFKTVLYLFTAVFYKMLNHINTLAFYLIHYLT